MPLTLNEISLSGKSFLFTITGIKNMVSSVFILIMTISVSSAQVLKDTATLKKVRETVDLVYNMQFGDAVKTSDEIRNKYPEHPVVYLLRGMIIYWQNYPLLSESEAGLRFEEQMKLCMGASEDFKPENEAEFLLANMCARGLLLAYYADNDVLTRAFPLGRTTYRYFRHTFKFTGTFPDFLFFTGLYNYYREAYPRAHPAYKPLLAIFPSGDMEKGLNELTTAFRKSIFLRAEASTFLSSIYKYFENDFISALKFSSAIYREHPMNIIYKINSIEDLLLNKRYDEAEKLITTPDPGETNNYFIAQISILRGVLYEKKYFDTVRAEKEYSSGIKMIGEYGDYGDQYAAYAWFGLSRISSLNNDRHGERLFRRKARDLTDFETVNFDD